ncbi:MAG: hypothetical protein Q9202_003731 [Teloschistes flavicans]
MINLVKLVSGSKQPSRLFFISSISSVMTHNTTASIPEEIVNMDSTVHLNGYAESKYLSELLLQHASEKLSLECSIARVGQLAGAAKTFGAWNSTESFPGLVISSARIGALPDSLGASLDNMDWIPIDLAAEILVQIAAPRTENTYDGFETAGHRFGRPHVYHVVNPHGVHWRSMRSRVASTLSRLTGKAMEIVECGIWIAKVRDELEMMVSSPSVVENSDIAKAVRLNPAAKLLDFYGKMMLSADAAPVEWEMSGTLQQCQCLADLPSLQEAWMER